MQITQSQLNYLSLQNSNLTANLTSFNNYLSNLSSPTINYNIDYYDFSTPYNGSHIISNPTGNSTAMYYTIDINNSVILQPFVHSEPGFIPLTPDNITSYAEVHASDLVTSIQNTLMLNQTVNYFSS